MKTLYPIHILTLTHKELPLEQLGLFYVDQDRFQQNVAAFKQALQATECMLISTCNRLCFIWKAAQTEADYLNKIQTLFYSHLSLDNWQIFLQHAQYYAGDKAIKHLFAVASSMESLVVGEREIITQVRMAYEQAAASGASGDEIRLIIKKAIECAKEVFTRTAIARKPVSVVSLAFRQLKALKIKPDARILMVGAGVTNQHFAKYLKKHGFQNFTVFNRTYTKAENLAQAIGGRAYPLEQLAHYKQGFDVLVVCTGAQDPVITAELYKQLLQHDASKKIIIDLAMPSDLEDGIVENHAVHYINISRLTHMANENMRLRQAEIAHAREIIAEHWADYAQKSKIRRMERALSDVPLTIKAIRESATQQVFAKELAQLDTGSKEIMNRMLDYFEKKYISVPMKLAKKIILEESK